MRKIDVINLELDRLHTDYNQLLDRLLDAPPSLVESLEAQLTVVTSQITEMGDILADSDCVCESYGDGSDIPEDMYGASLDD